MNGSLELFEDFQNFFLKTKEENGFEFLPKFLKFFQENIEKIDGLKKTIETMNQGKKSFNEYFSEQNFFPNIREKLLQIKENLRKVLDNLPDVDFKYFS